MQKNNKTLAFQRLQTQFAACLREPRQAKPPPGIDAGRLAVYQELVFNNLSGILASAFPVIHSILEQWQWDRLVGDYLAARKAQTPLFHHIPREFALYLLTGSYQENPDFPACPYLGELAHYEWVELGLELAPDEDESSVKTCRVSPLAWTLIYQYPVHHLAKGQTPLPELAQRLTYLLVYRNQEDAIKFIEINVFAAMLLELLKEDSELTIESALKTIAETNKYVKPDAIMASGLAACEQLKTFGIIRW